MNTQNCHVPITHDSDDRPKLLPEYKSNYYATVYHKIRAWYTHLFQVSSKFT